MPLTKGVDMQHIYRMQNRWWQDTGYKFEEPKYLNFLSALQNGMSISYKNILQVGDFMCKIDLQNVLYNENGK